MSRLVEKDEVNFHGTIYLFQCCLDLHSNAHQMEQLFIGEIAEILRVPFQHNDSVSLYPWLKSQTGIKCRILIEYRTSLWFGKRTTTMKQ